MNLFNFRLTPLESITPWGNDADLHLSWFGLTDGCYWLRVGDAELFRCNPQILTLWGFTTNCGEYVDYYVVRLWEDLLEILPSVLTPVPAELREKLAAPNLERWRQRIDRWFDSSDNRSDQHDEYATEWLRKRQLSTSYLKHGPNIWLWSDETHVHIEWDNRQRVEQTVPVWNTQMDSWSLSIEDFLSEVRAFDQAFLSAMQTRIAQIPAWDHPGIAIDQAGLIREQADRSTSLQTAFQSTSLENWSGILETAAIIEAETEI